MNTTQNKHSKLTAICHNAYELLNSRKSELSLQLGRDLMWTEIDVLPEYVAYQEAFRAVNALERDTINKALARARKRCPMAYARLLNEVKASGLELDVFVICFQGRIFDWALEIVG